MPAHQFALVAVRLGKDRVIDDEHDLTGGLPPGGAYRRLDFGPEFACPARRAGQGARDPVVAELPPLRRASSVAVTAPREQAKYSTDTSSRIMPASRTLLAFIFGHPSTA